MGLLIFPYGVAARGTDPVSQIHRNPHEPTSRWPKLGKVSGTLPQSRQQEYQIFPPALLRIIPSK